MRGRFIRQKVKAIKKKLATLKQECAKDHPVFAEIEDELRQLKDRCLGKDNERNSNASFNQHNQMDFENIVQNAFDAITINDANGDYMFVNQSAASISGYSTDELLTMNIRDLSPASEVEEIFSRSVEMIQGNYMPRAFESSMLRKDGVEIPVEIAAARIVWQGKPGDMVFIRDISVRKSNEELIKRKNKELQELNAVKDKFFSIIAHDLKNPIHQLQGFSSLLLKNYNTYGKQHQLEFLKIINDSAKHTASLLQDLLMWARSQSDKVNFTPVMTPLNELIEKNVALVKPNAELKGVQILYDLSDNPSVFVDQEMINTVFRNLLSNAIKFTPGGNRVTIGSRIITEQMVKVYIADEGVGMSEKVQAGLFQLDQHQTTAGTDQEKGTGLGLIVSKEFVERNGGEIWFDTQEEKGTNFFFTLKSTEE